MDARILRHDVFLLVDFGFFRPTGATGCTDGVKFGEEVDSSTQNFTAIGAGVGYGTQNC